MRPRRTAIHSISRYATRAAMTRRLAPRRHGAAVLSIFRRRDEDNLDLRTVLAQRLPRDLRQATGEASCWGPGRSSRSRAGRGGAQPWAQRSPPARRARPPSPCTWATTRPSRRRSSLVDQVPQDARPASHEPTRSSETSVNRGQHRSRHQACRRAARGPPRRPARRLLSTPATRWPSPRPSRPPGRAGALPVTHLRPETRLDHARHQEGDGEGAHGRHHSHEDHPRAHRRSEAPSESMSIAPSVSCDTGGARP